MVVEVGTQVERVTGRVWMVRLDPHGRPSAGTVRLSCSRRACAEERFPSAAMGRKAAVDHVNGHLAQIRAGGGPRGDAWCGCRAADCAWHTLDESAGRGGPARPPAGVGRCGGPVVLTVHAGRDGRLWRVAETCARCAAAVSGCRVLDTAEPPVRPAPASARDGLGAADVSVAGGRAAGAAAAVFSDHGPACVPAPVGDASPAGSSAVPGVRAALPARASRRAKRWGKIAQRIVPYDLQPDVLRLELIELGDDFRAYQQRTEPDLLVLAVLHERKARAFALWADVTDNEHLRGEALRAGAAAQTTREMHHQRSGRPVGDTAVEAARAPGTAEGPVAERLLTRSQGVHARTVLDYVQATAPRPDAPRTWRCSCSPCEPRGPAPGTSPDRT